MVHAAALIGPLFVQNSRLLGKVRDMHAGKDERSLPLPVFSLTRQIQVYVTGHIGKASRHQTSCQHSSVFGIQGHIFIPIAQIPWRLLPCICTGVIHQYYCSIYRYM